MVRLLLLFSSFFLLQSMSCSSKKRPSAFDQAIRAEFYDAARVKGLTVSRPSGESLGVTGNEGDFSCLLGELVVFKLAGLEIGRGLCDSTVFTSDLYSFVPEWTQEKASAVIQTFQVPAAENDSDNNAVYDLTEADTLLTAVKTNDSDAWDNDLYLNASYDASLTNALAAAQAVDDASAEFVAKTVVSTTDASTNLLAKVDELRADEVSPATLVSALASSTTPIQLQAVGTGTPYSNYIFNLGLSVSGNNVQSSVTSIVGYQTTNDITAQGACKPQANCQTFAVTGSKKVTSLNHALVVRETNASETQPRQFVVQTELNPNNVPMGIRGHLVVNTIARATGEQVANQRLTLRRYQAPTVTPPPSNNNNSSSGPWQTITLTGASGSVDSFAYGNNLGLIVTQGDLEGNTRVNKRVFTSSDLVNWTDVNSNLSELTFDNAAAEVIHTKDGFLLFTRGSSDFNINTYVSADGVTWSALSTSLFLTDSTSGSVFCNDRSYLLAYRNVGMSTDGNFGPVTGNITFSLDTNSTGNYFSKAICVEGAPGWSDEVILVGQPSSSGSATIFPRIYALAPGDVDEANKTSSWTALDTTNFPQISLNSGAINSSGWLVAGGRNSADGNFLRSNNGTTWTASQFPDFDPQNEEDHFIYSIVAVGENFYVSRDKFFKSTDNGVTWTEISRGASFRRLFAAGDKILGFNLIGVPGTTPQFMVANASDL